MSEREGGDKTMTGCFSEEIEHLIFSKEFESLVSSMQRFNVFKALGVPRRELSHSVFLAYVFDPHKPHGCGSSIASAFLRAAYREAKAHGCSQLQLLQVAFLDLDSAIVRRELGYIDILIDVPSSRAVFAIENKIEAGEQLDQLSRYQDFISRNFSLSRYSVRVLLFLTPMGWLPTTVNPGSNVPVIPISYRCVLDALDSGLRCCNNQTAAAFIENAIDHIREEIMLVGPDRDLI
ncbi:MAG: PD-(D/E)XK nuclease family protein, partial [Deltaproteobacteria bacterium]|nr:PD-(D/E)XK nuclease family protein [Deltaproteobacteria bacterium]